MANQYLNKTGLSRLVYKIKTLIQDMSKEAYLVWGGKNVAGGVSPVDAAACDDTNANRLAFHPADCIDVEYSTDGGKTWLDYDATAVNKTSLVTTYNYFCIGKKSASKATINDKLRITITAKDNHHYWQCQKLLMFISTSGANDCKVLVETRHINETSFSQYGEYKLLGWGGWNSIPFSAYFSAQTNTGHVHKIRLTFTAGSVSGNYNSNLSVGKLRMIAPTCYLNANGELGLNGRIYSLSADKSVTFPNKVTATSFVGATATSTSSGLMSAADKKNLDELPTTKISSSATSKGVKVSLGGTINSPTISVETTTGGIASNNTGVVSGAAVKEYVDANKGVSTVFKAQTSSSNAENGLVPAPTSANATKFLRGDGSWQTPTNTTYSAGSGLSLSGTSFSLKTGYTTSGKNYAVQLDSSGNPYVNVPWTDTDTNTTYNVVTSSVAGLAPKIGTAAAATIGTQSTEWVLTSTSGGTPTWRKLPENAFNNTTYNAREFVGDYTYDLGSFYSYDKGCLIEIGKSADATMVAIHVAGNGYGATKPINSMYQFYDYNASNGIINCGAICLGASTGDMVVYRYNNKVYAWIKQQEQFQTLSFRLYTNKSALSPVVTNAAAHTSGISNKMTISPSGIYAGSNTTTPDWSNSTDARKGVELLQTVGSAPTSGSAPSNYSVGLRVSGYYSFMLANDISNNAMRCYRNSTNGWETFITDKNIGTHKAGDSSKLGGVAAASYATKDDITNGNITAAKATNADSATAIGGKGLNDLVQGGGTIKYIKVVTSLPASPSNDTLYLIKQ